MNQNYKAVLLTILTLSVFTLTIIELTGVSQTAIFNKFHGDDAKGGVTSEEAKQRTLQAASLPKTTVQFYETTFDFGHVKEGKVVKHAYHFKNTGSAPLLITRTDVSCGCTVPSFSKEPVAPGAEGEITVAFNSSGKSGKQQKNLLVHSNAQQEAMSLSFEADVK